MVRYMHSSDEARQITDRLISAFSTMIDLDLTADRALYDGLLIHIKPLINRLNFRIYIRNPLLEDIKGELTDVWPLTQRAVNQVLAAGASMRFPTTRLAISPFISVRRWKDRSPASAFCWFVLPESAHLTC